MIGQIRTIRDDKDYAFIICGANRDIFLHKKQFQGDWNELREKWRLGPVNIEFEAHETVKGLSAITAKIVE